MVSLSFRKPARKDGHPADPLKPKEGLNGAPGARLGITLSSEIVSRAEIVEILLYASGSVQNDVLDQGSSRNQKIYEINFGNNSRVLDKVEILAFAQEYARV